MTYYTVYQVTNQVNGKTYIGTHKTENLDDGYMGSGKYLNYAINKHGIDKFTKEILFVYDNPKDMYDKETELVDDDFIAEANTYNLKRGGMGGFDYINDSGRNLYGKNGTSGYGLENLLNRHEALRTDAKLREEVYNKISKKLKDGYNTGRLTPTLGFKDKSHKESTKQKIGATNSIAQSGERNSQFGTMWITNGTQNKKIKKNSAIPQGWQKGRKIIPE